MTTSLTGNRQSQPHGGERGFTFIELMLVVVILAIVAAAVVPSFVRSLPSLAVRSAAREVMALALRAQSEAAARAVPFRLNIDIDQGLFFVTGEIEPFDSPGEFLRIEETWGRDFQLDPRVRFSEVQVVDEEENTQQYTAGTCEITFYPDGTATEAEIVLAADDGSEQRITIDGLTGRIRIESPEEETE